jgi:hypothetical protein
MKHPLLQMLVRWSVLALGVALSTKIIPGIHVDGAFTLFCVVLLLTFFNAILKPLLVFFTLPFIVLSMGVGLIVIKPHRAGVLRSGILAGFWRCASRGRDQHGREPTPARESSASGNAAIRWFRPAQAGWLGRRDRYLRRRNASGFPR